MSKSWNELLTLEEAGVLPPALLSLWKKNSNSICSDILVCARRQSRAEKAQRVTTCAGIFVFACLVVMQFSFNNVAAIISAWALVLGCVIFLVGWGITTSNAGGIMESRYQCEIQEFYKTLNYITAWSKGSLFKLASYSEEQFRALATGILTVTAAEIIDFQKSTKSIPALDWIDANEGLRRKFQQRYDTFHRLGLVKKGAGWKPYFDAAGEA